MSRPVSEASPREWGFWTEVKLDTLERYLKSFTTASKRAQVRLYLDLCAGQVDNVRRDNPNRSFAGSTVRALRTYPQFDRLLFFELPHQARTLGVRLAERFPDDKRFRIVKGDCNDTIERELGLLKTEHLDSSPTFALVDPDRFTVKWSTLCSIASFKHQKAKTKAEMWILVPHTMVQRLAAWDTAMGYYEETSKAVTSFFGTRDWRFIYDRRSSGYLTAAEARGLYVQLFRHRLEKVLGYKSTLTIEMGNVQGSPVYTMVFATDHGAGVRIMSSVYRRALQQSAEYRAEVVASRKRKTRLKAGRPTLFDALGGGPPEEPISFETTQNDESPILPRWLEQVLEHN